MKPHRWIALGLLFAAAAVLRPVPASAVVIGFAPPSPLDVIAGVPVDVDVIVSDLGGGIVSAYDLDVTYDPGFLTATGVVFGPDLGDPFFFQVLESSDRSIPGLVDFAALSLLSDAELAAIQGPSVTLATLQFDALASGPTSLALLFGPGNDVKGANNQVILPVAAAAEAATWVLLAPGLALVMLLGRRPRT